MQAGFLEEATLEGTWPSPRRGGRRAPRPTPAASGCVSSHAALSGRRTAREPGRDGALKSRPAGRPRRCPT